MVNRAASLRKMRPFLSNGDIKLHAYLSGYTGEQSDDQAYSFNQSRQYNP